MVRGMTIRVALKEGTKQLKEITEASWLDASLVLSYVLGCEKWYLTAHDNEVMDEQKLKEYFDLIEKRLRGVPVQYIIMKQEFMSFNFFVNGSVLIPRPDTEILVEEVIRYISTLPKETTIHILDIGTGSGCIPISIAKFAENTRFKAVDISKEALEVAEKNASILGVAERIEFIQSDLFQRIGEDYFDIIVSNPPYIPTKVIESLQVEVRKYEPEKALDGGEDGLHYYRRIIAEGFKYLKPGGILAMEIGYDQAEEIKRIIDDFKDYNNFRVIKDLGGRDRVICTNRMA